MSEAIPLRNKCMLLSPLRFTACPKDWRQWREIVLGRGCVGRRRHALPPRRRATLRTCSTGGGSEGGREVGIPILSSLARSSVRRVTCSLPRPASLPAFLAGATLAHFRSYPCLCCAIKGTPLGSDQKFCSLSCTQCRLNEQIWGQRRYATLPIAAQETRAGLTDLESRPSRLGPPRVDS